MCYRAFHRTRRVNQAEVVLNASSVNGVGVVTGPCLVTSGQDPEVDPSAAAGATLNPQMGVLLPEAVHNTVNALDMLASKEIVSIGGVKS